MTAVHDRPQAGPAEAPFTLADPPPKVLGFWDQSAFWANLGVSLLAFSGAYTLLAPDANGVPQLSILAGIVAMIVGTAIGGLMLGLSAVPGARVGSPAMVMLRGLFGARLSYVPTVLNIAQMIGWGTFELIVIADASKVLFDGGPRWLYVIVAGVITTTLTIWPLGSVRLLRRYVTIGVVIALVYFYIQLINKGLPDLTNGSWGKFWLGADFALAVSISWVPLAADFTRHSRTPGTAFAAASVGYSITQVVAYTLGLFTLAFVAGDPDRAFDPFLSVTLGAFFFAIFVLREADQSFANVYSTAMSIQNLTPKVDRRILTVVLGTLFTGLALILDIGNYADFLSLIGSVFVPMLGVLAIDFFLFTGRRGWDVSERAPSRWGMIVAWALGVVTYQLINPGSAGWWSEAWINIQEWLGFTPESWMSASLFSFFVAAVATASVNLVAKRQLNESR